MLRSTTLVSFTALLLAVACGTSQSDATEARDDEQVSAESPSEQCAPRDMTGGMTSTINISGVSADASFSRGQPFQDGREVIVRRGSEMGRRFGMEIGRNSVLIDCVRIEVARVAEILSPPPAGPGQPPVEDRGQFPPEFDVIHLPDAEVSIPRLPASSAAFSDAEVQTILGMIRIE